MFAGENESPGVMTMARLLPISASRKNPCLSLTRLSLTRRVCFSLLLLGIVSSGSAQTLAPDDAPDVANAPEVANTPDVANTPQAANTPQVANTPEVANAPEAANTPQAANAPQATNTPQAANTPNTPNTLATQPPTPELVRVQNLVRANVLGLAQEILETRGPALATVGATASATSEPSAQWLQWERQLWALYRAQGQWQKLYERTRELPPTVPAVIHREAQLQAVKSLTALHLGSAARSIIRTQLLAMDAPQPYQRQLRQALIAAYLADDLLPEARIAMAHFARDYGTGDTDWRLLGAGVLLRSGDADAAVNLLAPLDRPGARLLRLYARLGNQSLTPDQVIDGALELLVSPHGESLAREIQAVMAQANIVAGKLYPLADVLEEYLLTAPPRDSDLIGVYPQFAMDDLFDVYTRIAAEEANRAGLLIGEDSSWLDYALKIPASSTVARKSLFAYLALTTGVPHLRLRALDGYVEVLIDIKRITLIEQLFTAYTRLGKLSLGGATGLRLSAAALNAGNFQLAAEANANLSSLPATVKRTDWLLQAGRVDILAGRHQPGADKLTEWIEMFEELSAAQTDAILQPIFDLQSVQQHSLALELLSKVNVHAPSKKYQREIAYWMAESHHGNGHYYVAADLFLHSALQQADGFDQWGEAARYQAAESLTAGKLYDDARRLLNDLLTRAQSDTRRNALKQKLQRLSLLQSRSSTDALKNEQ